MPSVGAELASVPFGKMIFDMASAIARSQTAMDQASIQLVRVLARTQFDYLPDVVEVLQPKVRTLTYTDSNGDTQTVTDSNGNPVLITGVQVEASPGPTFQMSLLQAGVNPTFYQFTNTTISVKMSITSTCDLSDSLNLGSTQQANQDFDHGSSAQSSHVNASFAAKFSYSVEGSSSLQTTLSCVPPPKAMMPRFVTVNAIDPNNVTISQS